MRVAAGLAGFFTLIQVPHPPGAVGRIAPLHTMPSQPSLRNTVVEECRSATRWASSGYLMLRHENSNQCGLLRLSSCFTGAIKAPRRSASRCHWSRLSMIRPIIAKRNFSIARSRSNSMRNSFISRRIIGIGSDASGNCGAGDMRVKG